MNSFLHKYRIAEYKDKEINGRDRQLIMHTLFEHAAYCLNDTKLPSDPIYNKCMHLMRNLLNTGLDLDSCSASEGKYNNTLLMWLLSYGKAIQQTAALALLSKEINANPFVKDKYGKHALHFLLLKGHEVQRCIVDRILEREDICEHINDVTLLGDTAMHIACARRDIGFITKLLNKGASITIKNCDGHTPIDLLHLDEEARLDFLIRENQYLDLSCIGGKSKIDKILFVATIDKSIFNSDPFVIEQEIQRRKTEAL